MGNRKNIAVLSLQGDFLEHKEYFSPWANVFLARQKDELSKADAIILPGGESTSIGKMLRFQGLEEVIIKKVKQGVPILGTCAGAIILGRGGEYSLGLIDITVERNAYGRQINSFEVALDIPVLGKEKFSCVFIRAPRFISTGKDVEVLASHKRTPVFVRKDNIVCLSFHPELSDDRFAEWFVSCVLHS